jgi:polar amino acid transport system ATP-binding protein
VSPSNTENISLLKVKDLHKSFQDNHILKGINFELNSGLLVAIIGRSGCGKTTFLRCLNCLELFDSGTLHIAGVTLNKKNKEDHYVSKKRFNIFKRSEPFSGVDKTEEMDDDFKKKSHVIRTRVGMVFQSLNLFPNMTVLENVVKAPLIVKGESNSQAHLRAIQLLEKVGMDTFIDRMPSQLSGGQAQRVAIARALAMSPQLMLYDEPTSALDPELVEEVIQVMINLKKEGMTQIVVTHSMSFARTAADLVVFMDQGQIVEISPPNEMFSNPKDSRTREYLKLLLD